jgi:drug/metabolite transporter (DMT)-like permease
MLIRAALIGLSFNAVALMGKGLPPLLLTSLRFVIAAITILPPVVLGPRRLPSGSQMIIYWILGLCQVLFFGGMFLAAQGTSPVTLTVVYISVPFLTYCLGILFGVERRSLRMLGILATGAIGALGLAWAENSLGHRGSDGSLRLSAGLGVFFAGCVGMAVYAVVSKWGIARHRLPDGAAARTFWSLATAAVLAGIFGLLVDHPAALNHLDRSDLLLLLYLGVLSTSGTFYLQQRATPFLSPAAVSAYSYAPPFFSMLLLFVTEPGTVSWRWAPGSLLILLAIALLLRGNDGPGRPSDRSGASGSGQCHRFGK